MAAGASGSNHPPANAQGRNGKHRPADLDAVVKDAKNLMNELSKAPALSSFEAAQAQAARDGSEQHTFDDAVDMLTGKAVTPSRRKERYRRIKSQNSVGSGHSAPRSSNSAYRASAGTPRSARGPNSRSMRSGRTAAAYENIPLPRSILEQPIADAARDAYYGGLDDESAALTPTRKGRSAKGDGPRSSRSKRSTRPRTGPHSRHSVTPRGGSQRSPSNGRFVAHAEAGLGAAV